MEEELSSGWARKYTTVADFICTPDSAQRGSSIWNDTSHTDVVCLAWYTFQAECVLDRLLVEQLVQPAHADIYL